MFHVPHKYRLRTHSQLGSDDSDGNNGCFFIPYGTLDLVCIASDGMGWEHISVSLENRCPTWDEMCFIKKTFWDEEDCVVQFHPPKSLYVNRHPYVLHLWRQNRPSDIFHDGFPIPETFLVG